MHQLKLTNYNSESRIIHINLKILSKIKCIGEVSSCVRERSHARVQLYGKKTTPSTNLAKRNEFLKFFNYDMIGDIQNA